MMIGLLWTSRQCYCSFNLKLPGAFKGTRMTLIERIYTENLWASISSVLSVLPEKQSWTGTITISKSRRDGITIVFLIDKNRDLNSEGVILDDIVIRAWFLISLLRSWDGYLRPFCFYSNVIPSDWNSFSSF